MFWSKTARIPGVFERKKKSNHLENSSFGYYVSGGKFQSRKTEFLESGAPGAGEYVFLYIARRPQHAGVSVYTKTCLGEMGDNAILQSKFPIVFKDF